MAYGVAAGGLFAETAAATAATEASLGATVYGTGAAAGASMFSSLMPIVGIGYLGYSIFSSMQELRQQKKEQEKLRREQSNQARLLIEKTKADTAELYSSVKSATSQSSGAMGAIY